MAVHLSSTVSTPNAAILVSCSAPRLSTNPPPSSSSFHSILLASPRFFLATPLPFPFRSIPFTHTRTCICFSKLDEVDERPPSSKEEAALQARSSLATLLDKAVRNSGPSTVKQKRRQQQRQLRFLVEIPLLDDSIAARASLLLDLLAGFSTGKRAIPVLFGVFCDPALIDGLKSLQDARRNSNLQCFPLANQDKLPEDTQVVVIVAPKNYHRTSLENITRSAGSRPVVLLNLESSTGEERDNPEAEFLQSFDVVYSFTPLAIEGLFSKTEGAVLKHVKSGAPAGRPWLIFVKEGDKMKCVSSLKKRPDAAELENALYNSVAANSPVTKSIKFLRELVGGR